ncbi:hypothetical protein V8F33_008062 [Rhypophila sp. PSN 637]
MLNSPRSTRTTATKLSRCVLSYGLTILAFIAILSGSLPCPVHRWQKWQGLSHNFRGVEKKGEGVLQMTDPSFELRLRFPDAL